MATPDHPATSGGRLRGDVGSVLRTLRTDPTARLMGLGALIGAVAGLVAGVFDKITAVLGMVVLGSPDPDVGTVQGVGVVVGPVVGGLLAGLAIRYGTRQGRPAGIADVIEATWNRGGQLSLRNGSASALGAALALGGGQSGGREGPIVQLAGAVTSHLCRRLGIPRARTRVLVAAGAAAGIAASFNTPVGAAFFALEIILGNFAMNMFGPVVAATVAGTVVGQAMLGERVALHLPEFDVRHPGELLLYLVLGALCGGVALAFRGALRQADLLTARLPVPTWVRPGLAGLAVGLLAFAGLPEVMGNGYAAIQAVIGGTHGAGVATLVLILVAKLVATATCNAGRTGAGLFAPALFIGAIGGTAYGVVVNQLWPGMTESAGAYGMVGMGAVAAAVTHSPITIALMLFEMTRNYEVILPLLLSLAVSGIVVAAFSPRGLYEEQLEVRGVRLERGREGLVMYDLSVADLQRDLEGRTIHPDAPFSQLATRLLAQHDDDLFVVTEDGRYHGVVELLDVKHLLVSPQEGLRVQDVETRDLPLLRPDQPLAEAMPCFFKADVDELPVVDADGRLVGTLRERDVVGALDREVLRHEALLARIQSEDEGQRRTDFFELPPGQIMRGVPVRRGLAGQTLRELALTHRYQATVVAVVRSDPTTGKEQRLPAAADLVLREGDRLVVLGPAVKLEHLTIGAEDLDRTEEVPRT